MHGSDCKCGPCTVCKIFSGIVVLVLTLTTVAAFMGAWMTHVTPAGWVFGSQQGSLALIVLIASVVAWLKIFRSMCKCSAGCGCGCGGGCGCGSGGDCGGNCGCGKDGGKCAGCDKSPCACK